MIRDSRGMEDLPLRIVVTIIVGAVALTAVVGYTLSSFPHHKTLEVSVNTMEIEEGLGQRIEVTVTSRGNPIKGANVLCTGCGGAASGKTDENGKAILYMDIFLPQNGRYEDFLDLAVKAKGYEEFNEKDYIKVSKADYSEFLDKIEKYTKQFSNIENYAVVDEFPSIINGYVEENKKNIYILAPETANLAPDEFYISFQGDGSTAFQYKVIEIYGDENPPSIDSVEKIEWKDGYISWIPKEIQGSNCVYKASLEHKSPRSVIIVVERDDDLWGSGEYTIYLDYNKHYTKLYNMFLMGSHLLENLSLAIYKTIQNFSNFLEENYQNMVEFLTNPLMINEVKKELLAKIYETLNNLRELVLSIATNESINYAYKLLKSIEENISKITYIESIADAVDRLLDLLNLDFYLILEPYLVDGIMPGIKFGFQIKCSPNEEYTCIFNPTGILFIDCLVPEIVPIPNIIIDCDIKYEVEEAGGEITIHSNLNPISLSERNYEVSAKIKAEVKPGVVGGDIQFGGSIGIGIYFNNEALIQPIKTIVLEVMENYLDTESKENLEFRMEIPLTSNKYEDFVVKAMTKSLQISDEICKRIGSNTGVKIVFSGNIGAGLSGDVIVGGADANLVGNAAFGITTTSEGLYNILSAGTDFVKALIDYLLFQSTIYRCDSLGEEYEEVQEEDLQKVKEGSQKVIEGIESALDKRGDELWDYISKNVHLIIDLGIGIDLSVGGGVGLVGEVSVTPGEISGTIKMNLGTVVSLLSLGKISTNYHDVMLSIELDSSVSVFGGVGVRMAKAGMEISFSTSKEMISINLNSYNLGE